MLNKISKHSPFFLVAFWSLLLLANFVPTVPQPAVIIGYLWKVEFALAGLICLTLFAALKFPQKKITAANFSKREVYWIILPVILFTLWSGLSIIWAESPRSALHHTLLWACYALFYILVRQIVFRPKLLDVSLKVAGVVVAILGLLCLIEYLAANSENSVAVSLRYSKYAEVTATLLPVFIALSVGKKSRYSLFLGIVSILGWTGIIVSLGRTQFLAGLFGVIVFAGLVLFSQKNKISLKKSLVCTGFFVLVLIFSQFFWMLGSAKQSTLNRFSGDQPSQTSFQVRFLYWELALEMFKQNPVIGVGADNFSNDYNFARKSFVEANAEDSKVSLYENVLPERTHNEYLQILAELGIVGILLFGWFLLGIGGFLFSVRRRKVSVLSLAALAGIFAFFVSSLASSYSFRVPANGVCFFFLLALAANEFFKKEKSETAIEENEKKYEFDFWKLKPALIGGGLLIGGAMLIFSAVRGTSLMYLQAALDSSDKTAAEANYQKAIALDNREPLFRYYYGAFLYNQKRADEAVPHIRWAVNKGISTSINYFNLAAAQTISRQTAEAEQTFAEALRVYPRSVFLRTAYASFLESNGREAAAETEFAKAFQTNRQQAASWQIAHREGMEKLTKAGIYNVDLLPAMDLQPTDAVYALLDFQMQNNPALVRSNF